VTAVLRAWLGFLAIGAGLVHLALAIGAPAAVGIALLLIGIAESAWGVFALTAERVPVPRVARIASVVPLLLWVLVLLVPAWGAGPAVPALPALTAGLLDLGIAAVLTVLLRRRDELGRAALPTGRYLLTVGAGAVVVALLAALALIGAGATWADADPDLPAGHVSH
jgi:hypothetical protein